MLLTQQQVGGSLRTHSSGDVPSSEEFWFFDQYHTLKHLVFLQLFKARGFKLSLCLDFWESKNLENEHQASGCVSSPSHSRERVYHDFQYSDGSLAPKRLRSTVFPFSSL